MTASRISAEGGMETSYGFRQVDEQEKQVLLKALRECDFNRTAAAARLGLNLRQMRYRIQRLGIAMPGAGSDDDDGYFWDDDSFV